MFFWKDRKIDKPLARLIKEKKREVTNKIRNKRRGVKNNTTEIQRAMRLPQTIIYQ